MRRPSGNAGTLQTVNSSEMNTVPARNRADETLVDGLLRGEPEAIEALVARYGAWIYRVARRSLGDPRDAEEVTQDVLMTVVGKIATFRREAAFSSWLYRIAANAACERVRSRRSRAEVPLDPLLGVFDDAGQHVHPVVDWSGKLDDAAVAEETRSALERGISRLPEEYRVVLVLRDVEGLTNEETAEALGLTVPAVKSRLHRARLFLRQELGAVFAPSRPPGGARSRALRWLRKLSRRSRSSGGN
jgi:RNA polymerase sigma-70 factor, ECF subfamily